MVYITDYAEFQAKALDLLQRDPIKVFDYYQKILDSLHDQVPPKGQRSCHESHQ